MAMAKKNARSRSKSSDARRRRPRSDSADKVVEVLKAPHTLFLMFALLAIIMYYATTRDETDSVSNLTVGIRASSVTFLYYCMVQLKDGDLIRPHPFIFRVVHGVGILYLMLLVLLLMQAPEDIYKILRLLFDKRIGEKQVDDSYAEDCRLYIFNDPDPLKNLKHKVFDRFTIAHLLGWFLKALILRDWTLMWITSVMFEIFEVTFQHIFSNFAECWWDHLFLDIFGMNLLGMVLGMKAVRYMEAKKYNWSGLNYPDSVGKMKRVLLQFTPYSFTAYRFQVFSSWRRWWIGCAVFIILSLGELNAFFIKSIFRIPINSDTNLLRLAFWIPMTYMSVFDFHQFAEGSKSKLGINAWLSLILVALELILCVKHDYQDQFLFRKIIEFDADIFYGYVFTFGILLMLMLAKVVRRTTLWIHGIEEIFQDPEVKTKSGGKKAVPNKKRVHVINVTNRLFQILVYLLPVPFLIVLTIDCYRTMFHNPDTAAHSEL